MLFPSVAFTQSADAKRAEDEVFIQQVLADVKENQDTLQLYTRSSVKPLVEISATTDYEVVKRIGARSIIRFFKPSVPIWVKEDLLEVVDQTARVRVSSVKLRAQPDIKSFYIGIADRNYRSAVLAKRNNFIQILAPAKFEYSIFAEQQAVSLAQTKRTPEKLESGNLVTAINNGTSAQTISKENADTATSKLAPNAKLTDATNSQNLQKSDAGIPQAIELSESSKRIKRRNERQHILSPGDSITLQVFGEPDLSVDNIRIPSGGRVSFPLIGPVEVAGRTTAEIEKAVAALLAQGYVKNPRLSVTIFSYRPIFIRGAVNNVGAFPYSEGLTVANAIAIAGGTKNSAQANGVSIERAGEVIRDGLSSDSQTVILSGDVIDIAEEKGVPDEQAFYVYLHGEVANPGEYLFRKGLTVEKAVVLAGGFTLRASRRKIKVTRYTDGPEDQKPKKLKRVELYTPIEPGDIIDVGASWF